MKQRYSYYRQILYFEKILLRTETKRISNALISLRSLPGPWFIFWLLSFSVFRLYFSNKKCLLNVLTFCGQMSVQSRCLTYSSWPKRINIPKKYTTSICLPVLTNFLEFFWLPQTDFSRVEWVTRSSVYRKTFFFCFDSFKSTFRFSSTRFRRLD